MPLQVHIWVDKLFIKIFSRRFIYFLLYNLECGLILGIEIYNTNNIL